MSAWHVARKLHRGHLAHIAPATHQSAEHSAVYVASNLGRPWSKTPFSSRGATASQLEIDLHPSRPRPRHLLENPTADYPQEQFNAQSLCCLYTEATWS